MENGAMARDANSIELEQLYNGFVKRLVNSYDKLKTKFNTYAAKCLSEKQKRECGLALIAPALVMPHDRAVTDDDQSMLPSASAMMMNPQGAPSNLLRDNMSPRSKRLAMLAQKRFEEDADEEMKVGSPAQASDLAGAHIRMGGRMGQQI